ncbi:MAG: DUF1475 domain-containing protein [Candidatus Obscuribacter sp.]|nr:DUF1475 domain-containing protein [Candidatus Obscuribacter sp.]MBK9204487.1 DUF1475 domain-containing protein [Candidatus Obscuribacter sp.]MBK9622384.1 DUF1475 domain-containing protein [Candidatus Obscuribacter sp.]MBK9773186.1 DUF1475 domain-containing protein [Candidatus Obscuribacter sp.]
MITLLKVIYAIVLIVMIAVTAWSGMHENILAIPPVVLNDVWFKATLFDAYFGFMSFFFWICYREKSLALKVFLFFAIVFLGNIAMAIYALVALFRLKPGDGVQKLFARR